jgi:hypothetical protein
MATGQWEASMAHAEMGARMKPRIRYLPPSNHYPFGGWECGLMESFFDAGWEYLGMSRVRGTGITPAYAFKVWQAKTEAAAVSAAQS